MDGTKSRRAMIGAVLSLLICTWSTLADRLPQSTLPAKPLPQTTIAEAVPSAERKAEYTLRSPVGHTHTCPKCGNTWDHKENPGHHCYICRTPQYLQDLRPRQVRVYP